MTSTVLALIALIVGAEPDPRAEADRLVNEGASLGQQGLWDQAIERFEAADALFPRAIHACNIGLAHARAARPEKALVSLAACQARATEPLPSWVATRIDDTRALLAAGDYAPLELVRVTQGARVTIDHFPGALFAPPVTVWLPFGTHHLHAEATGYEPLDLPLDVTSKMAQRVAVQLEPEPEPAPDPGPEPPVEASPEVTTHADTTGSGGATTPAWIVIATGGTALAIGAIFYGLAIGSHDEAEGLSGPDFDAARATFSTQRDLAYGFLAGGAVVTGVGVVLLLVLDESDDVVVAPALGGAVARVRF